MCQYTYLVRLPDVNSLYFFYPLLWRFDAWLNKVTPQQIIFRFFSTYIQTTPKTSTERNSWIQTEHFVSQKLIISNLYYWRDLLGCADLIQPFNLVLCNHCLLICKLPLPNPLVSTSQALCFVAKSTWRELFSFFSPRKNFWLYKLRLSGCNAEVSSLWRLLIPPRVKRSVSVCTEQVEGIGNTTGFK